MQTLRAYKQEFSSLGVTRVGLFGSYARNDQTVESDIDMLIDFEPNQENFDNYMAVYDRMEELFKGHHIEIVTRNGLSKYIGPEILEEVQYA